MELDEPLSFDPEPCDDCATAIGWMQCYDDKLRCRSCVFAHAQAMGWDQLPERPKEEPATLPPSPAHPTPIRTAKPTLPDQSLFK